MITDTATPGKPREKAKSWLNLDHRILAAKERKAPGKLGK